MSVILSLDIYLLVRLTYKGSVHGDYRSLPILPKATCIVHINDSTSGEIHLGDVTAMSPGEEGHRLLLPVREILAGCMAPGQIPPLNAARVVLEEEMVDLIVV